MNTAALLDRHTRPGWLKQPEKAGAVRCLACAHRCLIRPGRRGICQVRFNRDGELYAPWGYVAGLQSDPVEKKPFYHLLPGSDALTFGMLGCDMHCAYCQNWLTSQTLRDPAADRSVAFIRTITPEDLVALAKQVGARLVVSSYNEPFITAEWAYDIFHAAKAAGLMTAMVSNGHATPESLRALAPVLDALKVDLKSMQDRNYRQLGGVLQHVVDTIRLAYELGLWVEVVTLVVPGFNDSNEELWDAARFLRSISPDIPWHVTAFHKDYRMTEPENTPPQTLLRAAEIGQEAGLHYVYAGNWPGLVGAYENTRCPSCGKTLVARRGYRILMYHITASGACPYCQAPVPGRWPENPADVTRLRDGQPRLL